MKKLIAASVLTVMLVTLYVLMLTSGRMWQEPKYWQQGFPAILGVFISMFSDIVRRLIKKFPDTGSGR